MTITAALGGLKNAYELAKVALAARDEAKISAAHQALTDRIIDVQNAALALQEKQSDARDQIDTLKDDLRTARSRVQQLELEQAERGQYALYQFASQNTAYKSVEGIEPEHFICQPCFDGPGKRKVVLLYQRPSASGMYRQEGFRSCPVCKTIVKE